MVRGGTTRGVHDVLADGPSASTLPPVEDNNQPPDAGSSDAHPCLGVRKLETGPSLALRCCRGGETMAALQWAADYPGGGGRPCRGSHHPGAANHPRGAGEAPSSMSHCDGGEPHRHIIGPGTWGCKLDIQRCRPTPGSHFHSCAQNTQNVSQTQYIANVMVLFPKPILRTHHSMVSLSKSKLIRFTVASCLTFNLRSLSSVHFVSSISFVAREVFYTIGDGFREKAIEDMFSIICICFHEEAIGNPFALVVPKNNGYRQGHYRVVRFF